MPLFMDVHDHIDGLTADVKCQAKYGVDYQRYWFDETTGKVFCLFDARTKDAAIVVHREAHGLVADRMIEVREGR